MSLFPPLLLPPPHRSPPCMPIMIWYSTVKRPMIGSFPRVPNQRTPPIYAVIYCERCPLLQKHSEVQFSRNACMSANERTTVHWQCKRRSAINSSLGPPPPVHQSTTRDLSLVHTHKLYERGTSAVWMYGKKKIKNSIFCLNCIHFIFLQRSTAFILLMKIFKSNWIKISWLLVVTPLDCRKIHTLFRISTGIWTYCYCVI